MLLDKFGIREPRIDLHGRQRHMTHKLLNNQVGQTHLGPGPHCVMAKRMDRTRRQFHPRPPRTPTEAEPRFFARYAEIVGGQTWRDVQRFVQRRQSKPRTVEEWMDAAREIKALSQQPTARACSYAARSVSRGRAACGIRRALACFVVEWSA